MYLNTHKKSLQMINCWILRFLLQNKHFADTKHYNTLSYMFQRSTAILREQSRFKMIMFSSSISNPFVCISVCRNFPNKFLFFFFLEHFTKVIVFSTSQLLLLVVMYVLCSSNHVLDFPVWPVHQFGICLAR